MTLVNSKIGPKARTILATLVTLDGVTKTAEEWAIERKINLVTVLKRRQTAHSWAEALTPVKHGQAWRRYANRPIAN